MCLGALQGHPAAATGRPLVAILQARPLEVSMGVHDHVVYHARHSSPGGNPQLAVLLQCGGSTGCARSASPTLLLFPRPTVWTYRLSVTFRSTSLSDRPRVRIDRQAVKLITKAYRLTLAFRSTSSGRPFAVAVGYLGLSVRRLRALAFRPTSAVRCSPLPSGTLVCLVVWSSSSCIVASPPQVRSKSARFWGSYVLIARRIDCRLHRLASKGGLCSCS